MTDTRTYAVHGATLTVTLFLTQTAITLTLTLDTQPLDIHEPEHSSHNLINYVAPYLPNYSSPESFWWSKRKRNVTCHTGSQAQRIIRKAIAQTGDAVSAALLDRERRKAEMTVAFTR